MWSIFKVFESKKKEPEHTCTTCKFGTSENCTVGTYYANKGINAICYCGELWESKV